MIGDERTSQQVQRPSTLSWHTGCGITERRPVEKGTPSTTIHALLDFGTLRTTSYPGDHLADALRWFAGFCLGMSGHDFYDPSLHGVVSSSGRHCESADPGTHTPPPNRRCHRSAWRRCNHYRVPQVIPTRTAHGDAMGVASEVSQHF